MSGLKVVAKDGPITGTGISTTPHNPLRYRGKQGEITGGISHDDSSYVRDFNE